jgi:hypothetical protein
MAHSKQHIKPVVCACRCMRSCVGLCLFCRHLPCGGELQGRSSIARPLDALIVLASWPSQLCMSQLGGPHLMQSCVEAQTALA